MNLQIKLLIIFLSTALLASKQEHELIAEFTKNLRVLEQQPRFYEVESPDQTMTRSLDKIKCALLQQNILTKVDSRLHTERLINILLHSPTQRLSIPEKVDLSKKFIQKGIRSAEQIINHKPVTDLRKELGMFFPLIKIDHIIQTHSRAAAKPGTLCENATGIAFAEHATEQRVKTFYPAATPEEDFFKIVEESNLIVEHATARSTQRLYQFENRYYEALWNDGTLINTIYPIYHLINLLTHPRSYHYIMFNTNGKLPCASHYERKELREKHTDIVTLKPADCRRLALEVLSDLDWNHLNLGRGTLKYIDKQGQWIIVDIAHKITAPNGQHVDNGIYIKIHKDQLKKNIPIQKLVTNLLAKQTNNS